VKPSGKANLVHTSQPRIAAPHGRLDQPGVGIGFAATASVVFTVQDATIKWLSTTYAVHEIVFARSLVAIALLALFAAVSGGLGQLRPGNAWFHLARGLLAFSAYTTYYLALSALPIATAITLFFAAPLMITAMSPPMLGERVGIHRWSATLAGFAGVLVMMWPGHGGVDPAALLSLAAAGFYAGLQIVTRRHGGAESAVSMAFSATAVYLVLSAAIGIAFHDGLSVGGTHPTAAFLTRAWAAPDASGLALMALSGLTFAIGFYALSQAYRSANSAVVAPFEYLAVPLGAVAGYLIWATVPDARTGVGALLIIGSGLYVLYRETLRGRRVAFRRR